jgi:uncharacterized membrane protein
MLLFWSGLVVVMAGLWRWQQVRELPGAAMLLGQLIVILLLLPGPSRIHYSQKLVWNYLLLTYGLCAAGLGIGAWLLAGESARVPGQVVQLQAIIVGCVGVMLLVRHGFHPRDVYEGKIALWEWSGFAVMALLLAHALLALWRTADGWPVRAMAWAAGVVGLFCVIIGTGIVTNPLWEHAGVGRWPVVNGLLFIYGLPCALLALLIPHLNAVWPDDATDQATQAMRQTLTAGLACFALLLLFVLVSLEVRQFFTGGDLILGSVGVAEMYSYSVAWIVLGLGLVALGIWRGSRSLRYASLVVMLAAIGKVFIVDTAHLHDLYRVLSLLGLGVSLLVLGYVYQKFVFNTKHKAGRV